MIGKLIARALKEAMEESHKSEPILLNDAAQLVQKEHTIIIDSIWPAYKKAELELKRLHNRLEEEKTRWSIAMREAQPALKDVECFEVNDAGTHCRIIYDSEEQKNEAEGATGVAPEWVRNVGSKLN
jgi:dephospho-CoA kinase